MLDHAATPPQLPPVGADVGALLGDEGLLVGAEVGGGVGLVVGAEVGAEVGTDDPLPQALTVEWMFYQYQNSCIEADNLYWSSSHRSARCLGQRWSTTSLARCI